LLRKRVGPRVEGTGEERIMKLKRISLALVTTLALGLGATPAHAARPIGGCPPAFQGPLDFPTILFLFPPPPDFPNPEEALASFDANGDRLLCVRGLPRGEINVIDNVTANA
jgi:hypothetical protein